MTALRRHAKVSHFRVGLPLAAFAWCAWLLVVNHRAPFARVWLWLYPLAAALAGAGAFALMDRWPRTRAIADRYAPAFAVLLALVMGGSVMLSRAVFTSRDTGTYRDAPGAAAQLGRLLGPGDRVMAAVPTNAPLAYYFDRLGLPQGYLAVDDKIAKRVFVVVDQSEAQTLDAVVGRSSVRDSALFEPPAEIAKLSTSHLFLFRRRDTATK